MVFVVGILVLFGIIELVMFGVNLKLRYLFIGVIVGSGIGLVYIVFFKVKVIVLGIVGLLGFILINLVYVGWLYYFVGMIILFIIVIIVILILFKRKVNKEVVE